MALKSDIFKYIIILLIAAFIISFFYMCTMDILNGNPNALMLLIFTWTFLLILTRFFVSKSLRLEEWFRYILLGALGHVGVLSVILIWYYSPLTSIIFGISYFAIILTMIFKDPLITFLYEASLLSISFDKFKPKALELNNHYYMIDNRPYRFITYFNISAGDALRLVHALKYVSKSRVNVTIEFYGRKQELECHVGLHVEHQNYAMAIRKLQVAVDSLIDLFSVLNVKNQMVKESEELERVYFLPLLAYKFSEKPALQYNRKENNNLTVSYANFNLDHTILHIPFSEYATFNLPAILSMISKTKQPWHPFWFGVNLSCYTDREVERKKFKLRMRFQHAIKKIKKELVMDDGRFQMIQLFSSTFKDPKQDSYLFNFLFREDYDQFELIKNEVMDFRKGLDIGLWKASFNLVISLEFLLEFQKYSEVEYLKLNKRQILSLFKRRPLHGQDLSSEQIDVFLGNGKK